jgi:antitoxin (DNA-binding transcriptional repressor) of toxin-antitoxin stability system
LQQVRAGEEIVIRDRNLPVAKLVPLSPAEASAEEFALVAAGKLILPAEELDEKAFWASETRKRIDPGLSKAARGVVSEDREDRDARLLGR